MRPIDADALIDKLPTYYFGSPIHLLINDAPTIQVEQLHGEWILECDSEGEGIICIVVLNVGANMVVKNMTNQTFASIVVQR